MSDYGYVAEFGNPEGLLGAVERLRERGYTHLEVYSPFPLDGLAQKLPTFPNRIAPAMLLGGAFGGLGTLALQYYSAAIAYPIDVGGRPNASWPAFIPPALEMTVLCAVIAGVLTLLASCGLPRFHHPLFELPGFARASQDRLFIVVLAEDPRYDVTELQHELARLQALHMQRIP